MKRLATLYPGIILFLFSFVIGMLVYQDYGISWDEPDQRELGTMSYLYVTKGDTTINTNINKRLGTGFELPLIFLEKALHLNDSREIYLSRHLATHLYFLVAAFCMYVLAFRMFKDQFVACLGFVLLAFHPRLYAHSFFNSKDIPFLSAFLIALLICQVAFEKNRLAWYILAGFTCAYATSIRGMGIMLLPVISVFFLFDLLKADSGKGQKQNVAVNFLFFILGFCGMLYFCWPYLWHSPFHNFIEAFSSLAGISWPGKVNFMGKFYAGNELPLSYMPVWFGITIPELWLLAGGAGAVWITITFIRSPRRYLFDTTERNYLLYLVCFAGPVIAMVAMHGVNIDDWRHLYFIYPSFVMLALFTVSKLLQGRKRWIVIPACILQTLVIVVFMIRNHPFQQVYFNSLVSHKEEHLRKNYDLEYWGCAYKQALEHLLAEQNGGSISVEKSLGDVPLLNNIMMLQERDRMRIARVRSGADYFITDFRLHPGDYPYPDIKYSIKVLNSTILCVYKTH